VRWQVVQVAESTFRRLKSTELLPAVSASAQEGAGVLKRRRQQTMAASVLRRGHFPCPGAPEGVKRRYAVSQL
jgi:hypothetical protein